MADLTIRDLDEKIVARLKTKAKENGRSLEAEARAALTAVSNCPAPPKRLSSEEARALAERIAAMTPEGVKQTDSAEMIREDRDR